jgi:tryptophan synthase alpha chain
MVQEAGADFVEVGIPFSDPLADGPVIQESTQVALKAGASVSGVISLIREAGLQIPVIAFGYLNPILAYGLPRFLEDADRAGVAGLLLTDLPAGEDAEVEMMIHESPLCLIRLVAPTTDEVRIARTVAGAEGFIYLISRLGVTGPETTVGQVLTEVIDRLRAATTLPIAVGFGIKNGEQAAKVARVADGVVVGSALVERLAEGIGPARELIDELSDSLRDACCVED